jgi:adenosylcobinamide hydrolase
MRYYIGDFTLFLRGSFTAVSTGVGGGLAQVSTVVNHTVPPDFCEDDPVRYLERIVAGEGLPSSFFGLLTAVSLQALCILQYDFLTVFVTAGFSPGHTGGPGTINIIVHSAEGFSDAALIGAVITVTEAKAGALAAMGRACTGTPTDAVVIACDASSVPHHRYAGILTPAGSRLYEAVSFGVSEALKRHEGLVRRSTPSFFIFSRFGGDHWVEWEPDTCPFYPCHAPGQACEFCYCPLYPCGDTGLGKEVPRSSGGMVWSCEDCTLLHDPGIAAYLRENPEASPAELKQRRKKVK